MGNSTCLVTVLLLIEIMKTIKDSGDCVHFVRRILSVGSLRAASGHKVLYFSGAFISCDRQKEWYKRTLRIRHIIYCCVYADCPLIVGELI